MSNQFVNATPLEFYQEVLKTRPQAVRLVEAAAERFKENPDECAVAIINPSKPSLMQIRMNGQRRWLSARVLLWVHLFGQAPTFGACTCGTAGCMNPKHQNVIRGAGDCVVEAHQRNEDGVMIFRLSNAAGVA